MTNLKPEERAREWIDRKLEDAGWKVINRDEYAPGMTAVAVREAAMRGGLEADYLLLINGRQLPYSKPNAKRFRSAIRT